MKINNAFNNNYIEYQSNGDKGKALSVKEHLDMIKQYLSDIMNDHKTQDKWKIQLTMKINFISSKHSNETRTMHTTSDSIEIIIGNKTDEIIEYLLQKYEEALEKSMNGSRFVFTALLYYITNFIK